LALQPFRFTKIGYQKFFYVRSRDFGNNRFILAFSLRASIKEEPAMDRADEEQFLEDQRAIPVELRAQSHDSSHRNYSL
jgi:hypothetical protein